MGVDLLPWLSIIVYSQSSIPISGKRGLHVMTENDDHICRH